MTRSNSEGHVQILLVEDNPGDIRLIREATAEAKTDTSLNVVTGGRKGLEYLDQCHDHDPDLVLLDLNLPEKDGQQVLKEIRNNPDLDTLPVVILTSTANLTEIHETYELEADGFFTKPVDPNEFMSTVKTIIETVDSDDQIPSGEYSDIES